MKGKTLVRIGAALTALSMLGTVSAFAADPVADPAVDISKVTVGANGDLTAEYTTASTDQNTYLVFGNGNAADVFADRTTEWDGIDIFDIDQLETKKTAFKLRTNVATKPSVLYLGIGGTGVTADFVAVNMTETVQSVNQPAEEDTAWAAQKVLKGLNDNKIDLPTTVTANVTPAGYDPNPTPETKSYKITGWKSGETELAIGEDGKVDISALDAADTAYTLTSVVAALEGKTLPAVSVTVTDKITVNAWELSWDPEKAVYSASAETATKENIVDYLTKQRTATVTSADFREGNGKKLQFTWECEEEIDTANGGDYTFTGTNPVLVDEEGNTLPDGVTYQYEENIPESVTAKVNVSLRKTVNVTGVKFVNAEFDDNNAVVGDITEVTETPVLATFPNDVTYDEVMAKAKTDLPTGLQVTAIDAAEPNVGDIDPVVFPLKSWDLDPVWVPTPDAEKEYKLIPKADPRTLKVGDDYIFEISGLAAADRPYVTATVAGKAVISEVVVPAAINAGTIGGTVKDKATIMEELGTTVLAKGLDNVEIPVSWACADYDPSVAKEYTFVGTLGTPPTGYKLAEGLTTIEVKVTVNEEAVVPKGMYGDVDNSGKDTAEDATYVFQISARIIKYADLQAIQRTKNGELTQEEYNYRADVDGSGKPTAEDATYIFQKAARIIKDYPVNTPKN